ncbi:MAG: cobaltochelatase subunit CobN [Rickettsiales bacterium]
MHLSVKQSQTIEDVDIPLNPEQTPADIVFLSFTDSDLSCMAAASSDAANIRISRLSRLKHPLSVDLYIEQVAAYAKVIIIRLLGGYDWWKYGVDELARLASRKNIKLIMISGNSYDHRLFKFSNVERGQLENIEQSLAQGGVENFRQVFAYACGLITGAKINVTPKIMPYAALYREVVADEHYGNIAIIFYRAHYLAGDVAVIDSIIESFRSRNISVKAFMISSLKDDSSLSFLRAELDKNPPDILIDATFFSAGNGEHPLAYLDIPVLQIATANMSYADWQESKRGLSTSDMAMQVVLPEADGRIFTRAVSFTENGNNNEKLEFIPQLNKPDFGRVEYVTELAVAWMNLRKKNNFNKKLAVILSDYPQRDGRQGFAVGLDAFASVDNILGMLADDGYAVGNGYRLMVGEEKIKYNIADYKKRFLSLSPENQQAVKYVWGDIPTDDFSFSVKLCGNVVVATQPDRGSLADKKTGYHDGATPPCHNYLAFYFWLRDEFKMDALVHVGTHGNLEWLPAKTVAISEDCWPEVALGATPVIYPYIVSDAGEAAQAKRRISAVIISHMTPPLNQVELTEELAELENLTDEYGAADGLDGRRMKLLRDEIIFRAKKSGLSFAGSDDAAVMSALEAHLCDIKEQRVGDGLHVFAAGDNDSCAKNERRNFLAALSGRFVPPSAGGAPSRGRVDVLPTGRNLIGVDPRTIPTKTSNVIGKRAAEDFIRRYIQDNGDFPKNIMMDLWGSATLRTGGDEIAQALHLMGVNIIWDETTQRVSGFEIIADEDMQWRRVDVTLRISGLFRDMFPNLILLFDDAVAAIAKLQGIEKEWRIFGNAQGAYGAGTTKLVDSGMWKERSDLGKAYLDASQFAYGRGADGEVAALDLQKRVLASDALIHVQDLREVDVLSGADFADSEGGFAAAANMLGASPVLYHVDTTNPEKIKTRTLAEEISLTMHARAINPQWISGQMRHGYVGAAAIADVVDNLFALAASSGSVNSEQFDLVADAYLHDEQVREFLCDKNPEAFQAIIARLNEAIERGLWVPLRNSTVELFAEM